MDNHKITAFLLTGPPGVGKTTLVRKICAKLKEQYKLQGFYTQELRENGQRLGFDVVTLAGMRGILAREKSTDRLRRPKIGKYAVYVQDFEQIAIPTLKAPCKLMILDEIGRMELFSKHFELAVEQLLAQKQFLLATIPSQSRQPIELVEKLKSFPNSTIYMVNKCNRNVLANEISNDIVKSLQNF